MELDSGADEVSRRTLFRRWFSSDIELTTLQQHCGPSLVELGVSILELNLFKLFECQQLVEAPTVVIASCLCPSPAAVQPLCDLLRKYAKFSPSPSERRSYFEAIAYEAMVGQLPWATVITLCRQTDLLKLGDSPSTVSPVCPIVGFRPKQCYLDEG
eukprot:9497222-Pyramimonas_sp.AAC.1